MRTTVEIDDHLFVRAKKLAAERSTSLRAIVEDGLRLLLEQGPAASRARGKVKRRPLPVGDGGKPLPGIDLNDTSALLDLE